MKKILPIHFLFFAAVLFTSCSVEDLAVLKADNIDENLLTANITHNELLGTWKLTKMETEEPADLNGDNVKNNNLLLETDCFDVMSITFNDDKTFSSVNARMNFKAGASNDQFECMGKGSKPDEGTWEIDGDILTLKIKINENTYEHNKKLTFSGNSFSFKVEKQESQQYIKNDPKGTAAENITVIELEYSLPSQ